MIGSVEDIDSRDRGHVADACDPLLAFVRSLKVAESTGAQTVADGVQPGIRVCPLADARGSEG